MGRIMPAARLDVRADVAASASLSEWLQTTLGEELGVTDTVLVSEIELAVHEIWVNVVEHAYQGSSDGVVTFTASREGKSVIFEIFDNGAEFDPRMIAEPDPDNPQEGGYGLYLVRHLMDTLSYENTPDGNRWRLMKHVD